jgi:predicted RNA-binding protein with PUA-like domain
MAKFLLKTEPAEYSFDDLERERHTVWDGVSNALAVKHLREIHEGDEVVIYHTGDERQAVGLARVIRGPYRDAKEAAAEADDGVKPAKEAKAWLVDLIVGRRFPRPVTLEEMKANPAFEGFDLLRLPRLSVMPVSEAHWNAVLKLGGALGRR